MTARGPGLDTPAAVLSTTTLQSIDGVTVMERFVGEVPFLA